MVRRYIFVIVVLMAVCTPNPANGKIRFTNIACTALDPDFCEFEYCFLKAVNRSYQYMSLNVILHKPAANSTINMALLKKANGYRPFLYNVTVDGCKLMKNPRSVPVAKFIYDLFAKYSNINHSCPFEKSMKVEKLSSMHVNNMLTNILPFPLGDYQLDTIWWAYNEPKARVKVFVEFS